VKRFYDIGSDSEVTASENKVHLEKELIRLKTAAWFLEKFKAQAKEKNVEFSAGAKLAYLCIYRLTAHYLRYNYIQWLSYSGSRSTFACIFPSII